MPKAADAPVSPRQRGPALENLRNQKMARSALDYVRGSPMQFYEWLEKGSAAIPQGPEVWICGDCHVGNLGPVANADGRFKVEIRDFDQTVIGNPAHDLIRLGLSLAAAAVVSDLPGLTIAEILEAMIAQYEAAFSAASDKPGHLEEPKTIRKVNQRAADANWTTLAAEDMDGQNFRLPLGKSFWPLLVEERHETLRSVFCVARATAASTASCILRCNAIRLCKDNPRMLAIVSKKMVSFCPKWRGVSLSTSRTPQTFPSIAMARLGAR